MIVYNNRNKAKADQLNERINNKYVDDIQLLFI